MAGVSCPESVAYTSIGTSATTDSAVSHATAVATRLSGDTLGAA